MMRIIAAIIVLLPFAAMAQAPESILPKPAAVISKKPETIVEKTLEAPKLDALGIADSEGKFGGTLWKGSKAEDIISLLARQNLAAPSAAAHKLLTRLMTAPAAIEAKPEGSWLQTRLQTLLDMGEEKALKDMLAMIPADSRGEFVDRLLVEQELLKLNTPKACEKVTEDIGKYKDIFWLKANAFCLAKNKKPEEADLALQVLREQQTEGKPAFPLEEAVRKMLGDNGKIIPLKTFNLSPLELAIAIEAGLPFDLQIDKEKGEITAAGARFLTLNSTLSLPTRIQLAERTFRIGILPREQLVELYKAASFKPEAFSKATNEKQFPANPVEARALAFQLAEKTPTLLPSLRQQFPPDLAQRLFSPDTPIDSWKSLPVTNDIRVAAVHKAFGLSVDEAVWKKFAIEKEADEGANIAALQILKEAASSKHVGETALIGLWLMQYQHNSVTLAAVMEAFRSVGLEKEASALAEEILLPNE